MAPPSVFFVRSSLCTFFVHRFEKTFWRNCRIIFKTHIPQCFISWISKHFLSEDISSNGDNLCKKSLRFDGLRNLEKKEKRSRLISHAVARERTKPRGKNDELLYYSIQRFFDDSFISTILFLSLSLLFHFSSCFHTHFSLYPLRLIILFFRLMTEHTQTHITYTQIRTQWIACE